MEFIAIDVETANPDMASICQIGIAKFSNGELFEQWESLINPEDYFDGINIDIHGIDEDDVVDSPTFPEIFDKLNAYLKDNVSVCHTHFDRVSIGRACEKYGIPHIETTWLDSARVTRRSWEELAWSGYGLANVAEKIGYTFKHHNALEDAKAAGQILLAAIEKSGIDLSSWLKRVNQPIDPSTASANLHKINGNPDGQLYGEVLVFTGALEIPRREAADMAAQIGCTVSTGVTKKTTILVVGDQDITKLEGHNKSSKHRKAEELIAKGQQIRILKESDFKKLVHITCKI